MSVTQDGIPVLHALSNCCLQPSPAIESFAAADVPSALLHIGSAPADSLSHFLGLFLLVQSHRLPYYEEGRVPEFGIYGGGVRG